MMCQKYILRGKKAVPVADVLEWARWFEVGANRIVAQEQVGDVRVSTVFIGLDHNFDDDGPPLLFETMIFGGPHDQEQRRYSTWDEAEAGHAEMRKLVTENGHSK